MIAGRRLNTIGNVIRPYMYVCMYVCMHCLRFYVCITYLLHMHILILWFYLCVTWINGRKRNPKSRLGNCKHLPKSHNIWIQTQQFYTMNTNCDLKEPEESSIVQVPVCSMLRLPMLHFLSVDVANISIPWPWPWPWHSVPVLYSVGLLKMDNKRSGFHFAA